MNPAWSIIFFSTLAGCGQGLVVAIAAAMLAGVPLSGLFVARMLAIAAALLAGGLAASFLHLGHPKRAWRAALMWRTSWMSREVLVLPAFIGLVAVWWLAVVLDAGAPAQRALAVLCIAVALVLWYCTAMIYACLRFVQEWAHPLTVVNYTLIGLSSGLVLAFAVAAFTGESAFAAWIGPWALAATLAAWATRTMALRRNASLKPKSTPQSPTGINAARVVQKSMGMTAGSFNTREFFHRASQLAVRRTKLAFNVLGFALPALLVAASLAGAGSWALLLAVPLQYLGLLAERWFFFAQARHPQNLYYQTVS